MQRKLKSVFRRSSKSKGSPVQRSESNTHYAEASSPRGDRHRLSSDRHGRTSVDSSVTGSVYTSRSRPVSSVYDDHGQSQAPGKPTAATDSASYQPSDPNGGAIANDYKAYLPVLFPVDDSHGEEYIDLGGDKRRINGESNGKHEGDVVDSTIAPHSESIDHGNKGLAGVVYTGSEDVASDALTSKTVRAETGWEGTEPRVFNIDTDASRAQQDTYEVQETQSGVHYATVDGTADGEETELARQLRKDGVVDLRNTMDTDGEITWAPAVTHEVIKPHQHEIVQQKIYREIHNYEFFHRIQPVIMTEVLPPRHWIPNPNGEGLIEISAEELPARTGENRWWSICQKESPYAAQKSSHKYRTEPEIIDAGTVITEEGFERKETIIIHPPKLADLTGYDGPVQAVHFDHKTGKRWVGELTTMDKLHELQQTLDRAPDAQAFQMDGLSESLPKVPSSSIPLHKSVSGHSSTVHNSTAGHKMNAL